MTMNVLIKLQSFTPSSNRRPELLEQLSNYPLSEEEWDSIARFFGLLADYHCLDSASSDPETSVFQASLKKQLIEVASELVQLHIRAVYAERDKKIFDWFNLLGHYWHANDRRLLWEFISAEIFERAHPGLSGGFDHFSG